MESGKKRLENWICILNLSPASLSLASKNRTIRKMPPHNEIVDFDSYAPLG